MIEDTQLLRRYAENRSEVAFAELVRRRVDLVYSVALRQVGGDAHLAEDVTQSVFADLARKAPALSQRRVLSGWLYRSAEFAASDVVRAERRRRHREQESHAMEEISTTPASDDDWRKVRPLLDRTMSELDEDDRDAIALRFFENRAFADIGLVLRLPEDTARKRVERALDKMAALLGRHGINSPAAALGLVLAQQAVAAPVGLAASISISSLAAVSMTGVAAGGWALLNFMNTTRIVPAALGIAALVSGGAWYQSSQEAKLAALERTTLRAKIDGLEARLRGEMQRAATADADSATLLTAIENARSARPVPVAAETRPSVPEEAALGITTKAPAGWTKNGRKPEAYVVGIDSNQSRAGRPSAYVKSIEPTDDGFGGMMQTTSAEPYLGKRVSLNAWVKTEEANEGGGHLWLRVDGKERGSTLEFDNMDNRAPKGTTDWQPYSVVLDIPSESRALAFGFFVQGAGKMWVSDMKLDEVGRDVPSTSMMTGSGASLRKKPENLDFK